MGYRAKNLEKDSPKRLAGYRSPVVDLYRKKHHTIERSARPEIVRNVAAKMARSEANSK